MLIHCSFNAISCYLRDLHDNSFEVLPVTPTESLAKVYHGTYTSLSQQYSNGKIWSGTPLTDTVIKAQNMFTSLVLRTNKFSKGGLDLKTCYHPTGVTCAAVVRMNVQIPHTGEDLICLNGFLTFNAKLSSCWIITFLKKMQTAQNIMSKGQYFCQKVLIHYYDV